MLYAQILAGPLASSLPLIFPCPTPHQLQFLNAWKKMPMRGRWDRMLRITVYESSQDFDWGEPNGPIWFLDKTGIEYTFPEIVVRNGPDSERDFVYKYALVMYFNVLTPTERSQFLPEDFAPAFVMAYDPPARGEVIRRT